MEQQIKLNWRNRIGILLSIFKFLFPYSYVMSTVNGSDSAVCGRLEGGYLVVESVKQSVTLGPHSSHRSSHL